MIEAALLKGDFSWR